MIRPILRLTRPVTIRGLPTLPWQGREACVTLSPAQTEHPFEWVLREPGLPDLVITPDKVMAHKTRLISVQNGGNSRLLVLEHLMPLRIAGLLGVTIESTPCLPYFGNSAPFFDAVIPACEKIGLEIPTCTVKRRIEWKYPELRGGHVALTRIDPRDDGKLVVDVTIAYNSLSCKLGQVRKIYEFPHGMCLTRIAESHSQGWPPYRYWLSKMLSYTKLWKHHNSITWPQDVGEGQALEEFADHRCLDILGAFGLLLNGRWLSGTITSVCSGHEADVAVCQMASSSLIPQTAFSLP